MLEHDLCYVNLADFLKTKSNQTKFVVISAKRRQKAGFLTPRSYKIIVTKKKDRRKNKSEEPEGKEEKRKKQWLLS